MQLWNFNRKKVNGTSSPPKLSYRRGVRAYCMNYIDTSDLYKSEAIREWGRESVADPWLIAVAVSDNMTIVTNEQSGTPTAGSPSKNPKIPDVANYFGVKCIGELDFLRRMEFKL